MTQKLVTSVFFFVLISIQSFAQELKLFNTQDFDLNGNVKVCTVITNYGKEVFEFNEQGYLTKSTTAYNDTDQDVTIYSYKNGFLVEKRLESYKNNVIDKTSSMANFYVIESTTSKKIKEQIISYDKEFFEEQEYILNEADEVSKIISSHENAVDETNITYDAIDDTTIKSYLVNGIIEKTIHNSIKKNSSNAEQQITITKEYIDGDINKMIEERFDIENRLVYKEVFLNTIKGLESEEVYRYEYDDEGVIKKEKILRGGATSEKEFIFQFDNNEPKNWVKKIITPANQYTTRKIEYYPTILKPSVTE